MIVILDNRDSFVLNIQHRLAELSVPSRVVPSHSTRLDEIAALEPTGLIVSPGPQGPDEAGISLDVIREMAGEVPILGVCLGHQAIGQAFGGVVVRGSEPVHGKTSEIAHDGRTVFAGLPDPMVATRYHSLVVERATLPDVLEVSAWCDGDVIMGLRHRDLPVEGVQFHPESILTGEGRSLLGNFLKAGI